MYNDDDIQRTYGIPIFPLFGYPFNKKIGLKYLFYFDRKNNVEIKALYNEIDYNNDIVYHAKELIVPIGYSYRFLKSKSISPYIGLQILNSMLFDEKREMLQSIKIHHPDSASSYIVRNETKYRYQIGIASRFGLNIIIKKSISLNFELITYINKFILNPDTYRYKYYYLRGSIEIGVGYLF